MRKLITCLVLSLGVVQLGCLTPPGSFVPGQSDHLAALVGADTHFNALAPYNDSTAATPLHTALTNSGIRHVRDGNAYPIPSSIDNSIALQLDASNPYAIANDTKYKETQSKIDGYLTPPANPNAGYIELCANEMDNHPSDINGGAANWPAMLADCIVAEAGFINDYYSRHTTQTRIPIVGPSLYSITNTPALATALGTNKSLIDYANFHPGTGALNPEEGNIEASVASYATGVSKSGNYFVTEFGFSDRKNTTLVETMCGSNPCKKVTGYIYNRTNGIPESIITAYDVRSFLSWFNRGATRMYVYQFADVPSDCYFGAQGLVTADLTPTPPLGYQNDDCSGSYSFTGNITLKPEYTATKNFISLFADPGADFTVTNLPLTITPSSTNVQSTVVEKRNGTVLVALWRAENDYDWYGAVACTNGTSIVNPGSYPSDNHVPGCKTTSESATVALTGYTETRMDQFNADGSMTQTTTGLSNSVTLSTPYVTVLEYHT